MLGACYLSSEELLCDLVITCGFAIQIGMALKRILLVSAADRIQ